jgi:1-acyl-sn-glycerol-3-phosphate acyltransferase
MLIDIDQMAQIDPEIDSTWEFVVRRLFSIARRVPHPSEIAIFGKEHVPDRPVLFATNHTHMFDPFAFRLPLIDDGIRMVSWAKTRLYNDRLMGTFLKKLGNIPIASRGYVIASDFKEVFGRKPTDSEYRALRDHVDGGEPLADRDPYKTLEAAPRRMLGFGFDPEQMSYREAIEAAYGEMMQTTLGLARQGLDAGFHQHMCPQGAMSKRLTPGHIGVVEAAIALDLAVVPVGLSGFRELFRGHTPLSDGGRGTIRIGEPLTVDRRGLPDDFRPFHPEDERQAKGALQRETDRIMEAINGLLEPGYQWADDGIGDQKQGVKRFI